MSKTSSLWGEKRRGRREERRTNEVEEGKMMRTWWQETQKRRQWTGDPEWEAGAGIGFWDHGAVN